MSPRYPHIPDEHLPQYAAAAAREALGARNDDEARTLTHRFFKIIDRLYELHPLCTVCGRPMVAGQQGTHLSCRTTNPRKDASP
jgi:hypothetical protein